MKNDSDSSHNIFSYYFKTLCDEKTQLSGHCWTSFPQPLNRSTLICDGSNCVEGADMFWAVDLTGELKEQSNSGNTVRG